MFHVLKNIPLEERSAPESISIQKVISQGDEEMKRILSLAKRSARFLYTIPGWKVPLTNQKYSSLIRGTISDCQVCKI